MNGLDNAHNMNTSYLYKVLPTPMSLALCVSLSALVRKGCELESANTAQHTSQKPCHPTSEAVTAHSASVLWNTQLQA